MSMARPVSALVLLLVILCVFVNVKRSSGLTCLPCDNRRNCHNEPKYCRWGFTTGVCGCCITCAKGLGERCGGDFQIDGKCARGHTCIRISEFRRISICLKVPEIPPPYPHWDSSEEDYSYSSESDED